MSTKRTQRKKDFLRLAVRRHFASLRTLAARLSAAMNPGAFTNAAFGNSPSNGTDTREVFGTKDCSYYDVRGDDTKIIYYRFMAPAACELISVPFTNWDECTRLCLQEYDFYNKVCTEDSGTYGSNDFIDAHYFCSTECLKNSKKDPIPPAP